MSTTERARSLVAEQAAQWLVQLQDTSVTAAERSEFATWLRFSPAHVHEFLNARATWEALSGTAMRDLPDREALLRILRTSNTEVVIPLGEQTLRIPSQIIHPPARQHWWMAVAAVLVLALGGTLYWTLGRNDANHARFATAIGQQSIHTLPDGSTLTLNTDSHLRLKWSPDYRDVYLDRGEAVFEVARDATRPFRVWTGDAMVRAVGTRFNVYRAPGSVTVTVLEGRVEVTARRETALSQQQTDASAVLLNAGEEARIGKQTAPSTRRLEEPQKAVAWQARRLEFEGAPLSEVIAEFNRYHATQLVLEDAALASKRVDGTFDALDRDSLIAFLEKFEQLRAENRDGDIVIRGR